MSKKNLLFILLIVCSLTCPSIVSAAAVKLDTTIFNEGLEPGEPLKIEVTMRNSDPLQAMSGKLNIKLISVETDETIKNESYDFTVDSSISEVYEVKIPEDVKLGRYRASINAKYVNRYGEQEIAGPLSSIITVNRDVSGMSFLGIKLFHIGYGVIVIGVLLIAYAIYHHIQEKKKRYKLPLDYSTLPTDSKRSIFAGHIAETTNKAFLRLEDLKTHSIVAGATGGGKTIAAQAIVEEALKKNVSVVVFDPTAQWTGFLRKCNEKRMLKYYPKFGLKRKDATAFNGNIHAVKNPREKINVTDYIKPGEITIFTVNTLEPKDVDILVASTVREVFRSNLQESENLRLLVVYDEVHRLLPKYGGSGAGFLQIERSCREFRKWGIGLLLISQVLSDFVGAIKANISTEIQMRTRDENDLDRLKTKYGEELLSGVVKAPVSNGMLENPHYNKGRPYFVEFRPILHSVTRLDDDELDKYNKYNSIVDDLYYQLDQLEKEGVDVFDLRLEVKLALGKVKSGNFNMVDIYLDGVKPRIKSAWQKIGKQPKSKPQELVSEQEIRESIEKAKQARNDFLKKTQNGQAN